jgi:hypothetical protein
MQGGDRYHVRDVERVTSPTGVSTWRLTFLRLGGSDMATIDMKVNSAVFSALDLDAVYSAKELMRLRDLGAEPS